MNDGNQSSISHRMAGFIEWLASVPLAIPSIAVSLACLVTFIGIPRYGGALGMAPVILANTAKEIPTGMRNTSPAITKIGKGNIEMAKVCGYDDISTLTDIVVPLTTNDYGPGWMHVQITTIREGTIPLLFMTAGS